MAFRYDFGTKVKDWSFGKMVTVLAGLGFVILTALTLLALFTLDFGGNARKSGVEEWEEVLAKARAGDVKEVKAKAEAGDRRSQYFIGMLSTAGWGVPKDDVEAVDWIRKSAEQGYSQAQAYLARRYKFGEGVKEDLAEAHRWGTRAANQGDALGQDFLASLHDDGKSTNSTLAYKWYTLAIQGGNEDSKWRLNDLKSTMTKEQIAEGERRANEFVAVKE